MNAFSGDPYEGARRAYHLLHPDESDEGWETWIALSSEPATEKLDNFKAFAQICRAASALGPDIDPRTAQHIAYAGGVFEALEAVTASLMGALPISSCVPHHIGRFRARLVNPEAQFD